MFDSYTESVKPRSESEDAPLPLDVLPPDYIDRFARARDRSEGHLWLLSRGQFHLTSHGEVLWASLHRFFTLKLEAETTQETYCRDPRHSHGWWKYSLCYWPRCLCAEQMPTHRMKCCSGCRLVIYCSQECQRKFVQVRLA